MEGAMSTPHTILGRLSETLYISGVISKRATIRGALTIPTYVDVEIYSGKYEITPDFTEQFLSTANKTLTDDVTVKAIEVQVTSNTSGGKTVYIGGI